MIKRNIIGLVVLASMSSTASAGMVVSDHFDDGVLDSNWQISLTNANGWTYSESGSSLTVTDIISASSDSGAGGNFATVTLSQLFSATTDFQIGLGISWDSDNDNKAMQKVGVSLLDSSGDIVASVSYADRWLAHRGEQAATIGGSQIFQSGSDSLAFSGNASIDIVRTGETIDIYWGSNNILSGANSSEITEISLNYDFYSYVASGPSFFGSEAVDFINIEGTQVSSVPVPSAVWLLSSGLIGLIGLRKKTTELSGKYA